MKTIIISFFILIGSNLNLRAQEAPLAQNFGNTLNFGAGIGYYNYVTHALPVLHANYELQVAKDFTLAPFITVYSYQNYYYWGNPKYPYKNYTYRQTVVPIGVKGSYYFDQILNAGSKWDFYLGASLGFAIRKTTWENGYYGETTIQHGSSNLYADGHIGTEYHLNQNIGLFLDLSSAISTFGLAFHL
ncbi:MAG TPA: hypothetical protein VFL70_05850 [Bacteroidia bacterium]|nr:hypothetical protein [Bacteroidia bacterium]